jgi:hypothetical protein
MAAYCDNDIQCAPKRPGEAGGRTLRSLGGHHPWNREAILKDVPSTSGVYAVWNQNQCIYVGETQDLQRRLLTHLQGDNDCIVRAEPTAFSFEPVAAGLRGARQSALIFQLRPVCSAASG